VCQPSCTSAQGACDPSGVTPVCNVTTGVCVVCVTNEDCEQSSANGSAPVCDPTNNCVECVTDTDCMNNDPNTPYCVQESCSQCRTYMDCPTNYPPGCDSVLLQCGTCSVSTDCPPGLVCSSSNACVPGADAGG
jgi:hypothetical protein